MKTTISIILFLLSSLIYSQQYSTTVYDAGTNIEAQTGADICADEVIINGTYSGSGTLCLGALPVELLSFTSAVSKNIIRLEWRTSFEINNMGFDVERSSLLKDGNFSEWSRIAFINGSGTTNEQKTFIYEDKNLNTSTYKYRLKQTDYNGNYEYFYLLNEIKIEPPGKFWVGQNYPNPSNPNSKIEYEIPVNGKVTIKVYNLLGEEVLSIVNEIKDAGYYTFEFDGSSLASGVYFYKLISSGFTLTKKMILLK